MNEILDTIFVISLILLLLLSAGLIALRASVIDEIKRSSPGIANELGQPSSFLNTFKSIDFTYRFIMNGRYKRANLDDSLHKACRKLAILYYVQHFFAASCFLSALVLNMFG